MTALRARAAAMSARVALEASFVLGPADAAYVSRAVESALTLRDDAIDDEHDPRLLHVARTVLILLRDAGVRSADTLAAAAFAESLPALLPADVTTRAAPVALHGLRPEAATLLAQVPVAPPDDDLLERLVTAPAAAALIALAERLDHARHLHMMSGLDAAAFHAGIEAVYMPAATRLCPPLYHRLQRWARSFARRRL